jgi:DNA modification methylase
VTVDILHGDCREVLKTLPSQSVNCCVTSPPYFGLRDYGVDGQIGWEPSPDQFVAELVTIFREVRRVLRDDGTLWLNLGDSYCTTPKGNPGVRGNINGGKRDSAETDAGSTINKSHLPGLKQKDLIGIPWRVAFALQSEGWYLRQDIIWHKPNPMPESVTDRCTKAHEYIFLLSKSERYSFDSTAMQEPAVAGYNGSKFTDERDRLTKPGLGGAERVETRFRNRRSVWTVTTKPFKGSHFATFPPDLQPCILAGCPVGGTVLDPFGGAGTTGMVAERLGRDSILIELNADYCQMARARIRLDSGKVDCDLPEGKRDIGPLFRDKLIGV